MPDKKLTDNEQNYYFGIRRCGGTWEYCNGNCEACVRKDYYVSNKLDGEKNDR